MRIAFRSIRCLLVFAASVSLFGCGPGLCTLETGCSSSNSIVSPRLALSGLDGLSIRKNDCYPVTLQALDGAGQPMSDVTASVTVSASTGVALYSSLLGCQTYDSAAEQSTFFLAPTSSQVVFYFRSDVDGAVSLSASASSLTSLTAASQSISVAYSAFDGANGPNFTVYASVQDSFGRTYIGGVFSTYDDTSVKYIARLNTDGTLDTSFAPTGSGLNSQVSAIALQSDGKVVVGGWFSSYNGTSRPKIARLNSDGSLDTSFAQTGTGLSDFVNAIAVQSDGKIVVGGNFLTYNGTSRTFVARLNSDGSLDTSFPPTGSGLDSEVSAIALQSDGKVLVGGGFLSYNGTARPRIARLNNDGSLDTSFAQTGTGLSGFVNAIAVQSDGKIVVGGYFTSYNGTSRPYVARLNSDGSLDAGFATTGTGLNSGPHAISILTDGKVLLGGAFTSYNGTSRPYAARLNSDGSLDTSFAQTGTGLNAGVRTILVQGDGKVGVGGDFSSYNGASMPYVGRLNSDGSLDTSITPGFSGLNGDVNAILTQTNGKALLGGAFRSHNGISTPYLLTLNSDGSLDTSFAQTGTGLNGAVFALSLRTDGKVLVAGSFTAYNGTSRACIAQLNSDGALDTGFAQTGTGLNSQVRALSLQSDGKVVVGGWFTTYNGTLRPYVARVNSDGSLDTGFAQTGTGLDSGVYAVAIQSDGKILVGGLFSSYNGTSRPNLARLNSDGTLDTGFVTTGSGLNGMVEAIAVQSDGKVLVGGLFTSYNGTSRRCVARLNSDGTLDSSFAQTGTGLGSGDVQALSLQSDGKVVVGGSFNSYNGIPTADVARINSDGSLDTSFNSAGAGMMGQVYAVGVASDGKILAGGYLTGFNSSTVNHIVRLTYIGTLD